MKFWHSLPCVLPKFHFGTPLSVNRKMKDTQYHYHIICCFTSKNQLTGRRTVLHGK
ncbi:MAG: hypothetical protein GY795_32805 [Desulfobacterales bacterium]|nr:hypothetical protein [Desulfobacterales bacterium]